MNGAHLNAYVRDEDSAATGNGAHRRCVVQAVHDDATREMTGVDVVCHLDAPTTRHLPVPEPSQACDVATGPRRVHPRGTALRYFGHQDWTASTGERMRTFVFGI